MAPARSKGCPARQISSVLVAAFKMAVLRARSPPASSPFGLQLICPVLPQSDLSFEKSMKLPVSERKAPFNPCFCTSVYRTFPRHVLVAVNNPSLLSAPFKNIPPTETFAFTQGSTMKQQDVKHYQRIGAGISMPVSSSPLPDPALPHRHRSSVQTAAGQPVPTSPADEGDARHPDPGVPTSCWPRQPSPCRDASLRKYLPRW